MKIILLMGLVMFGQLHSVWAYALGGPIGNGGDSYQVPLIGYGLPGDVNAPKNLGEEYRRNTPVTYYAVDANFLDYFGSNGVVAVDQAFTILNNLTNVSSYSTSLSEFPLDSRHINFQAQALGLYDLKSATLGLMAEQLGLADPIRYTWTLHDRLHVGNIACPVGMEYLVIQRNFDYVSSPLNQLQYSPYVNDTLYSYQIFEECSGPNPLALAVPFSVDPLADTYSPVASYVSGGLGLGDYYTGLTRDDVAGLRYLLQTNNINWETTSPDSELLTTNIGSTNVISTLDLGLLSASSLTNDPATLQALFPNLIITSVTTNFTIVCTPNVVSYLTNYIGAPSTDPATFVIRTNGSNCSYQPVYTYVFGNVITNSFSVNSHVQLVTITLGNQIGAPAGTLATNVTTQSIVKTNVNSGSYFIIPAGDCGLNIVTNSGIKTGVTMTTNFITTATNANGFVDSQSIVTIFTNRQYLVNPIICGTIANPTGLYEGIENIKFVKSSFDSLLGQNFQPITNHYTMFYVTNGLVQLQHFQRVVTTPDFLFSAEDLDTTPADNVLGASLGDRNLNFDTANVLPRLAGPGTITPATTISYNKAGPSYFNSFGDVLDGTPFFTETPGGDVSDLFYATYFVWASYDGSTNAPVVYPNGTSIDNSGGLVLIHISPATLPNGTNGMVYPPTTFTATGGSFTPPYTWSATGLPAGLSIVSNPDSTATLLGTPTQTGTFIFTLTLTDYLSRSVQWNYPLIIQ